MQPNFELLAEKLHNQGYKLTAPRRAILETLLSTAKPLSPAEIQTRGQRYCEELGLVTVYRMLELMDGLGLVRAVHLAEGCHGYVLSSPGHTHHMICERCHAVIEIAGCEMGGFLDMVASNTGYQITGHWLEISGVCGDCRAQGTSEGAP
jgi:Fur family ferric uptake transcriptional regulator